LDAILDPSFLSTAFFPREKTRAIAFRNARFFDAIFLSSIPAAGVAFDEHAP